MRFGILNKDLGIAVIEGIEDISNLQMLEIKSKLPEGQTLESLTFFYMQDRDWIVLNKNHALYGFYSKIIQIYLKMSETSRREIAGTAPTDAVKAAFEILDDVINYRALAYRK